MNNYEAMNIRQMQAYAAICFSNYCKVHSIVDEDLQRLIMHLISILSAKDLAEWEKRGRSLRVAGRGDPLPDNLSAQIGESNIQEFNEILDSCVEVGLSDMYGESTNMPAFFMEKCISAIRRQGVALPSEDVISGIGGGQDEWGDAISENDFLVVIDAYGISWCDS